MKFMIVGHGVYKVVVDDEWPLLFLKKAKTTLYF